MSKRKNNQSKRGRKPKFERTEMDFVGFRVPAKLKKSYKLLCTMRDVDMSTELRGFMARSVRGS